MDSLYCDGNAPLFLALGRLAIGRLSPRYEETGSWDMGDTCYFCGSPNDETSLDIGSGVFSHYPCFRLFYGKYGVDIDTGI